MSVINDTITFNEPVTFNDTVTVAGGITYDDPATLGVGDGTGSPTLTLNKLGTGVADVILQNAGVTRWVLREDASEDFVIRRYDNAGVFVDAVKYDQSTGLITIPAGLTVSAGTVTTAGTLDVNGPLDLAGATLTMPANQQVVLRYVSQSIVHGDLTGGGAVSTIALTGEPTGWLPIAAYIVTSTGTTSSNAGTTGLTCSVGIAGVIEGYVAAASIFGAAGRKEAFGGTLLGSYRASDALIATVTATGGAADCAHIDSLALKIVVCYLAVSAE